MRVDFKAVNRATGEIKYGHVEADSPEDALKRVNHQKYVVTLEDAPGTPHGDAVGDARQGAIDAALGAPQPKQGNDTRPGEPIDDTVGGLPSWVATGDSMKTAQRMLVAFFGILALGAFGIFAIIQFDQQRITVGQVLIFGVAFAVVALAVIGWKVSAIAKSLQGDRRL